ncbi:unnamed protein product [Bursaphelenchus xylophilus]|uniref:(pine wood nematode) hypothetical protein n=1 Tax=Bursaphelenchus xylophilus TaxID=6326 RepID=A0A1I7SD20_BURXY|nr:unnamed protein product [Bursaphelenchus xylophilus]CAG9093083.1 unnamed protein product [Bursaphelenchus xylophilus]
MSQTIDESDIIETTTIAVHEDTTLKVTIHDPCCVSSGTGYALLYVFIVFVLFLMCFWSCWLYCVRHYVKRDCQLKIEKRKERILQLEERRRPDLARCK